MTIHVDICGPISVKSIGRNSYFLTMTTARDRYTRVEILKSKSEPMKHIMEYIAWLDRTSQVLEKRLHSDNPKELPIMRKKLK